MNSDSVHIVCLDAPSPPDYGGAIDMHFKIKALASSGKKIILHYFNYHHHRNATGLESLCTAVFSYPRKPFWRSFSAFTPYIISSRINKELIRRLNADSHPILLEGLHCAGIIKHIKHPERIVLRMHNEEAAYYHYLSKTTASIIKQLYYGVEARLLRRYQQRMKKVIMLACLSENDAAVFSRQFGFQSVSFIPCFIPWQHITSNEGYGSYCLYHGNMQVSENEEAAMWLITQVFSQLKTPLIIAGKGISNRLMHKAAKYPHLSFINNPSMKQVDELVREAQINVLPSLNNTGVKLKLLNALFNGRHCITNLNGVNGSQLTEDVYVHEGSEDWKRAVETLMQQAFTKDDIQKRQTILSVYNNKTNAEKLNALW